MANTFYNRIIRKMVVGFGNLFNEITMVRYNPDNSESERFIVPITYAPKEHYVMRLEEDYNLDKKVQMTLPRLSFEMVGLTYDPSRKQNTNIRNYAQTATGVKGQYNPVPYNFDFNLYLYVRNIEDGTQVIEHILPYFTPDYTIKLNLIPEMGIVKEIPVILNSAVHDTQYEGNRESDPRLIIWTLNFTVKGFVYGPTSDTNTIITSITNILDKITQDDVVEFKMDVSTGNGDYQVGELVYQGYNQINSTASARVTGWSNNTLTLVNIQGNFVSSQPIYGNVNSANYRFSSYNISRSEYAVITARANTDIVKTDDTEYTMDSSNTALTMDKINTPSVTIIESQ